MIQMSDTKLTNDVVTNLLNIFLFQKIDDVRETMNIAHKKINDICDEPEVSYTGIKNIINQIF
jgi:hypothetical protein